MKYPRIIFFAICFCCSNILIARNDSGFLTLYAGGDTTVSFEVYTPGGTIEELHAKPAFFFFDPLGNGSFPLSIYRPLADRYDFVLIGFNGSRNGMEFEDVARKFNLAFNELTGKYRMNPGMLCLAGFSGAGKISLITSSSQSAIPYVIYGGATIDAALAGKQLLGFAGRGDMNYTDLIDYDSKLNIMPGVRHFSIEYDGGHAWFDMATMENSFVWMQLNLFRDHVIPADTTFIQLQMDKLENMTDSFISSRQFIKAEQEASKGLYFLNGLSSTEWFAQKISEIEKNSSYKKGKKEQEEILQIERQTKGSYERDFFSKDTTWWRNTIQQLRSEKRGLLMESDERLLGFIGISCYYTVNDALHQNNLNVAGKILSVYRMGFPESSEQDFLFAVFWAMKNDPVKSDAYFREAQKAGFTEWNKDSDETILQYFRKRPLK